MFKLAAHLGYTVKELQERLTVDELVSWQAYDEIDPIGGYRMDLGFAQLSYLQVGNKKSSVRDFLPVDPNPMTDEMRQAYEIEQKKARLEQQTQHMIQAWND